MTERRTRRSSAAVEEPVAAEEPRVAEPTVGEPTPEAHTEDAAPPTAESAPPTTESTQLAVEEPAAEPIPGAESVAAVAESVEVPGATPKGKGAPEPIAPRPTGPRGLRARYLSDVVPALTKQFEYRNPNMVPRLHKIVVNVGLGEALTNAKAVDAAAADLATITGQKPIVTRARRSIAQFKIRTGNPIGLKVTLRGQRMWDFLERLTMLALPRIRDFRGTPSRSFDGRGNYSLGMREQIAFPEIDYDKVDRLRGLEVSIVTTAKSDEESKRLLELLGMPFAG